MRLLGNVAAPPRRRRRAGVDADLGDRDQLRRHGWRRGRQHRDADLAAPSGRQRAADLPARRGPRADPGVLVPLRLGRLRRRRALSATPCSPIPRTTPACAPAGMAIRTAERWLGGRLVGRHGNRPCARDWRGTYRCVVRYDGGRPDGSTGTRTATCACRCRGTSRTQTRGSCRRPPRGPAHRARRVPADDGAHAPLSRGKWGWCPGAGVRRDAGAGRSRRATRPAHRSPNVAMPCSRTGNTKGPTSAIRPGPTAPPATAARTAKATAQIRPAPTPRSAASSHRGVG